MKVLCVLNPLSCDGIAMRRWPQVRELLTGFGVQHELLARTDAPIDREVANRLERGGIAEFGAVAGIGGDGTQSATINGLMAFLRDHPDVVLPPYGFIPLGTANDIAKSFGLSSRVDFFVDDLRRAVSTLIHGADYWLDLGLLNGRYFADAMTVGLDSDILRERNRQKLRIDRIPVVRRIVRGNLLYTLSTGLPFWRHRALDAEVVVDGVNWYSGPMLNLIVNNTRIYAGEFDFCPAGRGNDGLLDVILFTGRTDYLRKFLLSLRGNPLHIRRMAGRLMEVSSHIQGRQIRIGLSRPEAAQIDGEEIPAQDKFEVAVVPHAIHIRTPAEP